MRIYKLLIIVICLILILLITLFIEFYHIYKHSKNKTKQKVAGMLIVISIGIMNLLRSISILLEHL